MNKRELYDYLKPVLEEMTLEQQIKFLNKIRTQWIPELIEKKNKAVTKCNSCGEYSHSRLFKIVRKNEIREENNYIDEHGDNDGWAQVEYIDEHGDNDGWAQVEYAVYYSVCPKCGHKEEKQKCYVRTI